MKATILFVTEIQPYPLYGGMYIHIYNVLESLCQHYNVVVLAPPVDKACPLCKEVVAWYRLPTYAIGLRNKVQNGLYVLRPRPEWQAAIQEILQRHRPNGVWFLYGHWGQYVPLVHQFNAFAVMMTQNVQSELTQQRVAATPLGLLRVLTQLRAWAEAHHERTLFHNFDCLISLTEIDRRYHAQFVGNERSILIPGYLDKRKYQCVRGTAHEDTVHEDTVHEDTVHEDTVHEDTVHEDTVREENLLILTGSFNSFQNSQGALWFLQEIWPQVRRACPTARLQLVGLGATQLPISNQVELGVKTIDSVPDIVPYLRRATIAVAPILHGSGIRFKVLEALAAELPVVSTSLGAQGIAAVHGESILLADDAVTFARAIVDLLQAKTLRVHLAERGHNLFMHKYTATVNTRQIVQLVSQLCHGSIQGSIGMFDHKSVVQ